MNSSSSAPVQSNPHDKRYHAGWNENAPFNEHPVFLEELRDGVDHSATIQEQLDVK